MIKSRSIGGILTTKSSCSQNQLNLDSPYQAGEEYTLNSIRHASEIVRSTPQSCINNAQPLERCKKRIKLRVKNNFPSDFFANPSSDMYDNKDGLSPGLPIRLMQYNTPKHVKTLTIEDSTSKRDIRDISSQLVISCSPALRDDPKMMRKAQHGFESENIKASALNNDIKDERSCSIEKGRSDSGLTRMKIRPFLESVKLHSGQISTQHSEQSDMATESQTKRRSIHQKPLQNMLRNDSLGDLKKQSQRGPNILIQEITVQESVSRPFDSTREVQYSNHYTQEELLSSYNSSRQGTVSIQQKSNVSCLPLRNLQKKSLILEKSSHRSNLSREKMFDFAVPSTTRTHRTATSRESGSTLPILSPVRVFETETARGNTHTDIESTNNTEALQENMPEIGSRVASNKALTKFHKSIIKPINLKAIKFGPVISAKGSGTRRVELVEQEQNKENIIGISVVTPIRKNRRGEITEHKSNNQASQGLTHSVSVKGLEFSFSHETNNPIEGFGENLCQKVLEGPKDKPTILRRQASNNGLSVNLGSQNKSVKIIKIQKRSSLAK